MTYRDSDDHNDGRTDVDMLESSHSLDSCCGVSTSNVSTTAGQAGDENIEERGNGVDDALEDGSDAIDNDHKT